MKRSKWLEMRILLAMESSDKTHFKVSDILKMINPIRIKRRGFYTKIEGHLELLTEQGLVCMTRYPFTYYGGGQGCYIYYEINVAGHEKLDQFYKKQAYRKTYLDRATDQAA